MEPLDEFQILALQIDILKKELDDNHANEQISDEDYNKQIAILAYQFAINKFPDECLEMLLNIKGDYFKKEAVKHFKEDESFFNQCSFIFEILSFLNFVPYDIMATQSAAKA